MLCKRPTRSIEDSIKEMQGHQFIIEEKLDGERMQLHRRGHEYFYCSRLENILAEALYLMNLKEGKGLHVFVRETCRARQPHSLYRCSL